MISHKHKCIFIHIPKCAGTTIEEAFGIVTKDNSARQNPMLHGWDIKNKLHLQHATPQQLIDKKIISPEVWDSYYKFIIVRNPWQRAVSSYNWIYNQGFKDSFYNFLKKQGRFSNILNDNSNHSYRGDHLTLQKEYLFLNSEKINYDTIIEIENIDEGLKKVIKDLSLDPIFFRNKKNIARKKVEYSYYFNKKNKLLFDCLYEEDIKLLNYTFKNKRNYIKVKCFFYKIRVQEIRKRLKFMFFNKHR